jgi:hypothetical protein
MKHLFIGLALICLSALAAMSLLHTRAQTSSAAPAATRTPVVVELFTSEGCSSCPPADALLTKLFEGQPVGGAEVIAIEEHVDYWNSLGWMDPFSSIEWTIRQQQYAESFGSGSVYTPQMVVDGRSEFAGSRERQSEKEIAEAARRAKTDVAVTPDKPGADGKRKFTVCVGKLTGGTSGDTAELWLAVTESKLQSAVTRGENAGEQLRHTAVLRMLRKIGVADASKDLSFVGDARVRLDKAWRPENSRVVVFVQERKSRRILGAAAAELAR